MIDRWVCRYFVAEPHDGTAIQLLICAIVIVAGLAMRLSMPQAARLP